MHDFLTYQDFEMSFDFAASPAYNKELEADVAGDTSGDFKRLLIGCLQANRPEGTEFDRNKAKQDAQVYHDIAY